MNLDTDPENQRSSFSKYICLKTDPENPGSLGCNYIEAKANAKATSL